MQIFYCLVIWNFLMRLRPLRKLRKQIVVTLCFAYYWIHCFDLLYTIQRLKGIICVQVFFCRKKLIEGSRGILQGTSSLLLCFDESEVRKIIRECKRVLDYLAITEVIETMEDLVYFLKNLRPYLSKVSREVSAREKELTHQVHREILIRCLDQVIFKKSHPNV